MKKIKVLQAVNSLGIGGTTLFAMKFFRNIDKEKFQVDFLIYEDQMDFYTEISESGSKVFKAFSNKKNKLACFIEQMKYTKKIIDENNYDIIHCHGCSFFWILRSAIPAKLNGNIKIISHAHSIGTPKETKFDNLIRNFLRRLTSNIVDMGFSCSDTTGKSKYTNKFIDSDKYHIIRNAVDIDKYAYNKHDRNYIRNKFNIENKLVIGNVGRLSPEKNQTFLLDILCSVLKKNNNAVLMIIGGGELKKELKEKAETLGIFENVIFTGSINNVSEFYSAMDVFVMPSIYEGLPFTAIEAQVNGLKCVFSDCISRMTDASGKNEFLSLSCSSEKWADIIISMSENRLDKETIDKVCKNYDIKNETKRMENYYIKLLKE